MKPLLLLFLALYLQSTLSGQGNKGPALPEGVVVERDIVYERVGDRELPLDLYRPADAREPLPLVIWVHGGGWRKGSKEGISKLRGCPEPRLCPGFGRIPSQRGGDFPRRH